MAYRPYKDLSTQRIKNGIQRLKEERANLRPSESGQASNYYAPAIYYHEEELKLREIECPICKELTLNATILPMYECSNCKAEVQLDE